MRSVGIIGIGSFLPPSVRTNDWWSASTVADWHHRMAARATQGAASGPEPLTEGGRLTLEAMQQIASDPFRGAVQRRVMPEGMTVPEMEAHAAREALQRAGVAADEIDAILTQTPAPDDLMVNSACITHRLLGLPRRCLALGTEAACNAFATHMTLAAGLIASGQARYVLSVHSSAMTKMVRPSEPDSAWWGDGAAAVVIGPVSEGNGLLSAVHHADGHNCGALVLGVPGGRWYDDGRVTLHSADRNHTRSMLLNLADRSRSAIHAALDQAGVTGSQVGFYASHQGTAWFTRVTAKMAGLERANTVVTFPSLGNLNSANIPLILAIAERERQLAAGTVVATFSGGVGETWSSLCLRWGR